MKDFRGEITIYVSLVFGLLLALISTLFESASLQSAKNYRRADMVRATESIFAEYQKELLEQYHIFGLDAGYETGRYEEDALADRLEYYGAVSTDQEIRRIRFLTDDRCQAFFEQAEYYVENKYGLDKVKEWIGQTSGWERQQSEAETYQEQEQQKSGELENLLAENEGDLPSENNPIDHVNGLKQSPLLSIILPGEMQVSEKRISLQESLSHRELNQGYGDFSGEAKDSGGLSMLLYGEYVMDHFSCATDEEPSGALDYEVEYILEGKASDRENLEAVSEKLLLMRFAANYAYLLTDTVKKAEAEAMALSLCTLLAVPAITEAAKQVILLAWAYGESVMDLRSLLKGNRVPFIKSKESWQLSLSSVLTLGTDSDRKDGADTEGGLRYKDYLRMLLFLEKKETAGIRTLDVIEQNLCNVYGQESFRTDLCVSKIEFLSRCHFRRGITYQFPTYFGYL